MDNKRVILGDRVKWFDLYMGENSDLKFWIEQSIEENGHIWSIILKLIIWKQGASRGHQRTSECIVMEFRFGKKY